MKRSIVLLFIAITSFACYAQDSKSNAETTKSFEFIATVNGIPITKGLLDLNLQAAIAQGQKDGPQLRETIKNELINRELIAQELVKQGIDKELDLRDQMTQLRQNIYLQAFIEDHFKKNPITTEQLREEYNKQKQSLGNGGDLAVQYQVSQIVLGSESAAIAVIGRLQAGDAFAKVAQEVSLDAATKSQGGLLGWVSLRDLAQPVANIVPNLKKGSFSGSPIKVADLWVIVKVNDVRSSKILSFEASQNQLKQAIVQQFLAQTIKQLRESSRIIQ